MLNRLELPSYSLRFGVALAAALLLLGAATPDWAAAATQAECEAEWALSDADEQCSNEEITPMGDECLISAECTTDSGGTREDTYKAPLDNISDLNNCNGWLKLESCVAGE